MPSSSRSTPSSIGRFFRWSRLNPTEHLYQLLRGPFLFFFLVVTMMFSRPYLLLRRSHSLSPLPDQVHDHRYRTPPADAVTSSSLAIVLLRRRHPPTHRIDKPSCRSPLPSGVTKIPHVSAPPITLLVDHRDQHAKLETKPYATAHRPLP